MQLASNYRVIGQLKLIYLPYSVGIQKKVFNEQLVQYSNASCSK